MTLNHLRTTGARMRTEVRELDRKMEEAMAGDGGRGGPHQMLFVKQTF